MDPESFSYRTTVDDPVSLASIIAESGQRLSRRRSDPAYLQRLAETAAFLADVVDGKRDAYWLREALSTSDFPLLMGDILDRQLLANYREWPVTWPAIARRGTVRDFRQVRRVGLDGLEGRFIPTYLKKELTESREDNNLSETGYTYGVEVYEKSTALNWRVMINDDLDAFRTIPERLARGARRTEDYFVTDLFVGTTGPDTTFFSAGNANVITGNPVLSIAGLQAAMTLLGAMRDADNEPIFTEMVTLVVPPALEVVARNILNATEVRITEAGGTTNQQIVAQNWMRNRVELVVNPYIPVIATSNQNTSWFLFANPSTGRPAIEVGFLRGFEEPGLYQKAPDTQRIGGAVDPMLGDFENNEIKYKAMLVIGGSLLSPKAAVASNGSGV